MIRFTKPLLLFYLQSIETLRIFVNTDPLKTKKKNKNFENTNDTFMILIKIFHLKLRTIIHIIFIFV